MAAKSVKIDFYLSEVPKGSEPFEAMIAKDAKTTDDETRNLVIRGFPVRSQQAHIGHEHVEGDMLRIQMSDIPPKVKLSGEISNLPLDDDEGIGGETAFLYHPKTKVLVVQRNKTGVYFRAIAEYFEQKFNLKGPILLTPVIQGDALKRLAAMKETRKLKIRLAGVTNPRFFHDHGKGLSELVDVLEYYKSPSCTFEMSMGHEPGSLMSSRILALARVVVGMSADQGGEVTTMEIHGTLDDDEQDQFDILMYRMVEVVSVQQNKHRRSTYTKRRPEILQAWNRRKKELAEMFVS